MTLAVVTALDAVVAMLGAQAAGSFQVIGYQKQKKAAESSIDNVLVQCFIAKARIDWSRCSRNGPKEHEVGIRIQFTVAQPATADIATLTDPISTDGQRTTALSNMTAADMNTSTALYAAWSAVFEILDDARNLTFGLPTGSISDKSYSDFSHDEPMTRGGLAVNTATSILEFRVKEAQLGDAGNEPVTVTNDSDLVGAGIDEVTDDISKSGVIQENP